MSTIIHVVWFDENYDNEENTEYLNELNSIGNLIIKCFKEIGEGIEYIKKIKFIETNIIISGKLYIQFIKKFRKELKDIYIIPKIIIFTKDKDGFLKNNIEYNNHNNNYFYKFGGITTIFNDIKDFISKPLNKKIMNRDDEGFLTFEYIDCKEKLYYPILYKALMDTTNIDKIDEYTNKIYEEYENKNSKIKNLLNSIKNMENIPIELLSKYYARLYTAESDDNNNNNNFYSKINKDLRENTKDKYLPFIKILYEGLKKKSLPLALTNILYRGTRLLNKEITQIKKYLKNKKEGLPGSIIFSKTFLSFSKDKKTAEKFLKNQKNENELNKVLFILEKDKNKMDYDLSTHADIEQISFYPNEKEVLFFPFSSFEIKEINENIIKEKKIYEIKLFYLGKYIQKLDINDNNKLPDSEFKKLIIESGLLKDNDDSTNTPKYILTKFNKYKEEINTLNYITSEVKVNKNDINKDIRIINSYEQFSKDNKWKIEEKYKNEGEIKNNIEIKIDDKIIPFSYFYKFKKKGNYRIKYTFKNNMKNINYMFSKCSSFINIDLSNFDTAYITNIDNIFNGCSSLININLSNFNTTNVTNMSSMFSGCSSLINIDLSNFNTTNVTDMYGMFNGCKSLKNINLSNFNTHIVTDMSFMFNGCSSLKNINLENFTTQNITYMWNMFNGCSSLIKMNIITQDAKILNEIK